MCVCAACEEFCAFPKRHETSIAFAQVFYEAMYQFTHGDANSVFEFI
jgi:hypothetical protein